MVFSLLYTWLLVTIGHFRIVLCLFFKARPRAKPFIWKWVLSACEWKLTFTWKAMQQDSLWKRGTRQLGNGLFFSALYRAVYLSWCANGHEPIHENWGTRGSDCHSRFTRFTLVNAVSDALQPPVPTRGKSAGKAKRPLKSSSSATLVVLFIMFQLSSELLVFHVE